MGKNIMNYTQNRELSWLKFNQRVLEEARDVTVPLLERMKFVAIFTSNLDEFFMIRVGSLFDMAQTDSQTKDARSGMTPEQQFDEIYKAVSPLYKERDKTYAEIKKQLQPYGVCGLDFKELEQQEKKYVKKYFKEQVLPILSPQIVDANHPFPHLLNKEIYVTANLREKDKDRGKTMMGIIPVPQFISEVLYLPGHDIRYIRMEKVIMEYLSLVFDNYHVSDANYICVTRNADISPDDESLEITDDFRNLMQKTLHKRRRMAVVRLEVAEKLSPEVEKYFCEKFNIKPTQIFRTKMPMKLSYAFAMSGNLPEPMKKALTYPPFSPQEPARVQEGSIAKQIRRKDLLLFYPYESMNPFLKLIKEASTDPNVMTIKITIYRLAKKARLVEYLCAAAENGKEVTVLMELRARFDEANNINWSESLEEAGCTVLYGLEDYKVHSKVCQITLMEKKKIKRITQVGTGNYNEKTAKMYTDLSLMTADEEIGNDAAVYFKNMSIANINGHYDRLFVAPNSMKDKILALIQGEIEKAQRGEPAEILVKINSLTDRKTIDALKDASQAGVRVRMIIRGICCLLPDVEGYTENIQITSIVGRFLEHSRVYCFGAGEERSMYISSADFMTRNLNRRVEVACPVNSPQIKKEILEILELMLSDNVKARNLRYDGLYEKKGIGEGGERIDSQQELINRAITRAAAPSQSRKTAQEMPVEDDGFFSRLKRAIFG